MHVVIVTAGGAGMFCGSCMHDNTWARALMAQGVEVSLLPTYTPIRVDEGNLASSRVFFGGINVYLEAKSRLWRSLPRFMTRWLDAPWVIQLATRFGVSNDARLLGELTLAMLEGEAGPHRRDVDELAGFIGQLKPDVVCFSNALLCGALRGIRASFPGKVFCTLQGDDIFLEGLSEPYRRQAIDRISERASEFDGFITHSRYYRDFMSSYLRLPVEKFHIVPLGIDLTGHDGAPSTSKNDRFTVGYFARVCPEKGLHELLAGFRLLHQRHPSVRLRAGGYLGPRDHNYFNDLARDARNLGDAFEFIGSPASHADKVTFLKSLDVLSVPTTYHEPKGLPVLEAMANGVPVVQPRHGAFSEILESTGGGLLVTPGSAAELADALEELMLDPARRFHLAETGQAAVRTKYGPTALAQETIAAFES
ncbi:MAG: glycosyltransferase family 4 protein [Planctomycetaceae bacterium]|nr:glycosyltransferase family 4 protein [Planctomycetaceae bacterium]